MRSLRKKVDFRGQQRVVASEKVGVGNSTSTLGWRCLILNLKKKIIN